MAKNPGIIEIKLGACLTGPTKRMLEDLKEVANDLNRARNGMIRNWVRFREDHPNWVPEQAVDKNGNPKVNQKGEPVLENAGVSKAMSNAMYHAGRGAARRVGASLVASATQDVAAWLKGNTPYNHWGDAKYRWQQLLWNEGQAPSYRGISIPVPNNISCICWNGESSRELSKGIMQRVNATGKSSCVLFFTLFSRESGREQKNCICRLEVRQMSKGHRRLIQRICRREWKLLDSKIVFKNDAWYFQLTYDQPIKDHGLNKDNVATLVPCLPDEPHPFALEFPDGRRWYFGRGDVFAAEYHRIHERRKHLRVRYRYQGSGSKGHGRKRFYYKLLPYSRSAKDLGERIVKMSVADIIKACVKNDCGKIVYREPTKPLRQKCWFSKRNIPFDWTRLASQLTNKTTLHSLEYEVERMRMKEYFERLKAANEDKKKPPKANKAKGKQLVT